MIGRRPARRLQVTRRKVSHMGGSNSSSLVFLIAAAAMFYVLIIRPQQKRAKEQASMLSALEPGVEIVTIGGIYGTIVEVREERLLMRVADGSELEIARRAVGSVVPAPGSDDEDDALVDSDGDVEASESGPVDSADEPTGTVAQ